MYRRASGSITQYDTLTVPCKNGSIVRAVVRTDAGEVRLLVYVDGVKYSELFFTSLMTGKPGVGGRGMPSGNSISLAELGPLDRVAPSAINAQSIASSAFPNFVDFQWQGVTDDANGTGTMEYNVWRVNGPQHFPRTSEYTDATVSASTTYDYQFWARDYHGNQSTMTTIDVTTPETGAVDPRRVGVRPTGSYWGATGEQIDLLSSNLNYSLPLLKTMGRGDWGVNFQLSYNSQIWRGDAAGTWKLGRDVGYGFGWKLLAGALVSYWSDYSTLHHWTFIDSTGAEYRLSVFSNGVWRSTEGVYLTYDENTHRLQFPDGSFWVMDCISAGTEVDAGTRYPILMQDSNGNQVILRYQPGLGITWPDSSARIDEIEDVRAKIPAGGSLYRTYKFNYNTDPIPHLTSITNEIGTSEKYTFTYLTNQSLDSPFNSSIHYGTTTLLDSVIVTGLNLGHTLDYLTGVELGQVTLPYGAHLRWAYKDQLYNGRRFREVQYRYLAASSGAAEKTYTFAHDPGDNQRPVHSLTMLDDPSANGRKTWLFDYAGTWSKGAGHQPGATNQCQLSRPTPADLYLGPG